MSSYLHGVEDIPLVDRNDLYRLTTFVPNKTIPVHSWYPYLQGFSSKLVKILLDEIKPTEADTILDPFNGVGTTVLTSRDIGVKSVGFDISPLAVMVARGKMVQCVDNEKCLDELTRLNKIELADNVLPNHGIVAKGLTSETANKIVQVRDSISEIEDENIRMVLQSALISTIGEVSFVKKDGAHYRFIDKPKSESFEEAFEAKVRKFLHDLDMNASLIADNTWEVQCCDARSLPLEDSSISAVITSPPYLNRNNYIAQNKLELFMMECVKEMADYRKLTHSTLRSHVEARFDSKTQFKHPLVDAHIEQIEARLDSNAKNNKKIPEMVGGYFDDMYMVIRELSRVMKKDSLCFFVVGNSAWEGVYIEVDRILSDIFIECGFKVEEIRVTRLKNNSAQQIKKFGKIKIRESIIVARRY